MQLTRLIVSNTYALSDSLSLWLRLFTGLTLLHRVTRRPVLQKVRHHAFCPDTCVPKQHSTLTACKHMVSGSISFPSRGAFHLSLTVLVHYRSPGYLALESGLPSFPTGSSCPVVLRIPRVGWRLSNTGLSPSTAGLSRRALLDTQLGNYSELLPRPYLVLQLPVYNAGRLSRTQGLGCSRFVRHYYGNCLFSSGYLDVSVPPLASPVSTYRSTRPSRRGVAPFGDLRIGLSAAPRSFSQRNHVLLRPWLPRHPPYALIRL